MIKLIIKIFGRKKVFEFLFNEKEKTAIVNALYRRSDDGSFNGVHLQSPVNKQNEALKETCKKLARELL